MSDLKSIIKNLERESQKKYQLWQAEINNIPQVLINCYYFCYNEYVEHINNEKSPYTKEDYLLNKEEIEDISFFDNAYHIQLHCSLDFLVVNKEEFKKVRKAFPNHKAFIELTKNKIQDF